MSKDRVIIQHSSFVAGGTVHITALCDDGTLWITWDDGGFVKWQQVPNVPQNNKGEK